jgi:site-specific DNA-methyltransferase (adenine-specific)
MKPYYQDGTVAIFCGDCREVEIGPVAAVVTSPPYNTGVGYDSCSDEISEHEYASFALGVTTHIADTLIPSGRAWMNVGVACWHTWADAFEDAGLIERFTVAWDYGIATSDTAWGSWQSPSAPNLRHAFEPVICAHTGPWGRHAPEGYEHWRDEEGNWPELCRRMWRIAPGASTRSGHPAVMPVELARRCIRLSTWPTEIVYDPFAGSGTTLVAAKLLGRRAIGVEISERYCEIAAKRLAQGSLFEAAS